MESGIDALVRRAEEFEKIADLQFEFIEEHEELAPGVVRERYSDGTLITINHSDTPFEGIGAKEYRVERPQK